MKNRLIGIDYGDIRTGIALSDPDNVIAIPLEVIETNDVFGKLSEYLNKYDIQEIIVGLPLNLKGGASKQTDLVYAFIKQLKHNFSDKKVISVDERFSTKVILDNIKGNRKLQKYSKGKIDMYSAAYILQGYLDSINREC
ncbi:hypothetical protein A2483_01140 [Candidatus Peregrinibacteria bacterium RIFOXYC2_FULL_33_13]|nr:MAG: hypothetical protein A2229_04385 [Candidatus Peregrinibacteria bacterium RIFOXYA2_FULL_33_7]OGJ57056.1 MAG: hypothetical protein A2483_01140 [Candidatus Peregrinibacteria bacterium RIFOXYC2_FULL_33_13]